MLNHFYSELKDSGVWIIKEPSKPPYAPGYCVSASGALLHFQSAQEWIKQDLLLSARAG